MGRCSKITNKTQGNKMQLFQLLTKKKSYFTYMVKLVSGVYQNEICISLPLLHYSRSETVCVSKGFKCVATVFN